jgi:hypothetical protein
MDGIPESQSENDWLEELLNCHKVEKAIPWEGKWLEELLKCHKLATTTQSATESHSWCPNLGDGSESGKASSQHTISRQDGRSRSPQCFRKPAAAAPPMSGWEREWAGVFAAQPQQITREAWITCAKSFGPLPTVEIPAQDAILWASQPSRLDLSNVDCCALIMAAWFELLGPTAFKIGIAANPEERYFNTEHGYFKEGIWQFMCVCWTGGAQECRQAEISLITASRNLAGCYNLKPGGEGVSPERTHSCSVYLVLAAAGHGISLQSACAMRRSGRHVPSASIP